MMLDSVEKRRILNNFPIIRDVEMLKEVVWFNPKRGQQAEASLFSIDEINNASDRLQRFSSYIKEVFPETAVLNGLIESPLRNIAKMKTVLESHYHVTIPGQLLLKCDHLLPIAGSIKARGGIYEVLKHAEYLALQARLIDETTNYRVFHSEKMRAFLGQYSIAVGSTGNLGLSIGIMSAQLGFKVTVHMSSDAKQWKKDLLRSKGVQVIEYIEDYSVAVEQGREAAKLDPNCHFVDDENSKDLFAGYAVAALRLQQQLKERGIVVDKEHPLFVYLPCGVGGGPGGVAFGLHALFGDAVHVFFVEPTHSPCMLLGMATSLHDAISVQDLGIDNVTEADGLAVGRASGFVGRVMEPILSGCYTVDDAFLFDSLRMLLETEGEFLEPSAHAGMIGPVKLMNEGDAYIQQHGLSHCMHRATHIVWATGGSLVPPAIRQQYIDKDK